MSVLSPSGLETTDYGLQGWNAILTANVQRLNTKIGNIMDDANPAIIGSEAVVDPVELYGEMYGGSSGLLITPVSTWVRYASTGAGAVSGATYVIWNAHQLQIKTNGAGEYKVEASFTVSPDVACNLKGAIFKNGSEVAKLTKTFAMGAGAEREMVLTGLLDGLVNTDYIELFVTSDVDNTTITVDSVNVAIKSEGLMLAKVVDLITKLENCGVLA